MGVPAERHLRPEGAPYGRQRMSEIRPARAGGDADPAVVEEATRATARAVAAAQFLKIHRRLSQNNAEVGHLGEGNQRNHE
jgi:hypothetical protein